MGRPIKYIYLGVHFKILVGTNCASLGEKRQESSVQNYISYISSKEDEPERCVGSKRIRGGREREREGGRESDVCAFASK
jgi:hypothetical protein